MSSATKISRIKRTEKYSLDLETWKLLVIFISIVLEKFWVLKSNWKVERWVEEKEIEM